VNVINLLPGEPTSHRLSREVLQTLDARADGENHKSQTLLLHMGNREPPLPAPAKSILTGSGASPHRGPSAPPAHCRVPGLLRSRVEFPGVHALQECGVTIVIDNASYRCPAVPSTPRTLPLPRRWAHLAPNALPPSANVKGLSWPATGEFSEGVQPSPEEGCPSCSVGGVGEARLENTH
jgi:hypothetical protein